MTLFVDPSRLTASEAAVCKPMDIAAGIGADLFSTSE